MAARDETRERNESGLRTFIESLKSLFNQLSRFNEGLQSIDEETLETFKQRLKDVWGAVSVNIVSFVSICSVFKILF